MRPGLSALLKAEVNDIYIGQSQFDYITKMHESAANLLELLEVCGEQMSERYLLALIQDYSQYTKDFGYISIEQFIKGWTVMTRDDLDSLKEGTVIYVQLGNNKFEAHKPIIEDCMFNEEIGYMFMTTECLNPQGHAINDSQEVLMEGDFYYIPLIHTDYLFKAHNQRSRKEKLCPILITKTKEP